MTERHFTRRELATGAGAVILATQLSLKPARAAAKYTRYNLTSPNGQKMLASYAKGVEAMLKLPADDPRNWFRNSFIHLMDCPHGNWWFYVWHRGYLGYFEQTIRELSGDDELRASLLGLDPAAADSRAMFDGALTPTDQRVRALHRQPRAVHLVHQADAFQILRLALRGAAGPAQHQGLHGVRQALERRHRLQSDHRSGRCRHFGKHGLRDHLRVALSLARQPEVRQGDRLQRLRVRRLFGAAADRLQQPGRLSQLHQLEDCVAQFRRPERSRRSKACRTTRCTITSAVSDRSIPARMAT